jgi:DNA polymerase-3 subunit gamma/tau
MADSHVLARKFRPQTFDQVIGQDAITRTLMNSLRSGRLHHAYLFTGARGIGKTTTARIFAKALNCLKGLTAEPCGSCSSCIDIAASEDLYVREIDAASHTGVQDVRDKIIETLGVPPGRARYKIFIIDEVHQLSGPAFNALLKTIEEPPPRVVFILATTDQGKVPDTILSRCQIFEFRTITLKKIIEQLRYIADKEGVKITDAAALAIARAGEGSMRDAESALDQVISFSGSTVTDEDVSAALGLVDIETLNKTLQAIADQDSGQLVRIVDEVVSRGYDLRNFCREMMVHIRALLVVKIAGFDSELVQLPESEADTLKRLGESFSEQDLLRFFTILTKTEQDIRNSSQPRFQLEIGLVKLAQARRLFLLEEALGRIQALESRLGGAGVASPSSPSRGPGTQKAPRPAPDSLRSSTTTRTATPAARAGGTESTPGKPQGRVATPSAEVPASLAPTVVAASATPARSSASVEVPSPPEPPPPMDERYDGTPEPEPKPASPNATSSTDRSPVDKIKAALEAKRKMMIVTALDKGTVSIDGDYLRVTYAPENGACKTEIEARDKRNAIEDASEQVLGRRLTLRASIVGQADGPNVRTASGSERGLQRKEKSKDAAEDDPKLRALVDKFHGEVIEVIKPEQ